MYDALILPVEVQLSHPCLGPSQLDSTGYSSGDGYSSEDSYVSDTINDLSTSHWLSSEHMTTPPLTLTTEAVTNWIEEAVPSDSRMITGLRKAIRRAMIENGIKPSSVP